MFILFAATLKLNSLSVLGLIAWVSLVIRFFPGLAIVAFTVGKAEALHSVVTGVSSKVS